MKEAEEYYRLAIRYSETFDDIENRLYSRIFLSGLLLSKQQNPDAIKKYEETFSTASDFEQPQIIKEAAEQLHLLAAKSRNFDKACEYLDIFHRLSDSLYKAQSTQRAHIMLNQIDYENKQAETILANKESEWLRTKNRLRKKPGIDNTNVNLVNFLSELG